VELAVDRLDAARRKILGGLAGQAQILASQEDARLQLRRFPRRDEEVGAILQ